MIPKITTFCIAAVTVTFLVTWFILFEFTFRHWQAVTTQIRVLMVTLVISFPLPWVRTAKDKFTTWRLAGEAYMLLLIVVTLLIFMVHPIR